MKSNRKLIYFLLPIFYISLTGCVSLPSYEDKGGRYAEATYIRPVLWEESSSHSALCYKYSDFWHSTIWPDVDGISVTNEVAVFEARKTAYIPDPDWSGHTDARLFAVRAPEMPMDITDEVLWRCAMQPSPQLFATPERPSAIPWPQWVKQSETNLEELLKNPDIGLMRETNNALEFYESTSGQIVHLDWNQVPSIMREVKGKGIVRKDRVEHKAYIEKVFKPEVQK